MLNELPSKVDTDEPGTACRKTLYLSRRALILIQVCSMSAQWVQAGGHSPRMRISFFPAAMARTDMCLEAVRHVLLETCASGYGKD